MIEDRDPRRCLREAIAEIFDAAKYLDDAVSAHLDGRRDAADDLIRRANMPAIRDPLLIKLAGENRLSVSEYALI